PGIEVESTGMSWRFPRTPWVTLEAGFTPPIDAALEPALRFSAGVRSTARYDEIGGLLPGQRLRQSDAESPFPGREKEIAAMAVRLMEASHRRGATRPAPKEPTVPEGFEDPQVYQQNSSPSQQSPRLR
ncbi:hypothetical protein, partial [Streptomyces sp. NPDC005009]